MRRILPRRSMEVRKIDILEHLTGLSRSKPYSSLNFNIMFFFNILILTIILFISIKVILLEIYPFGKYISVNS